MRDDRSLLRAIAGVFVATLCGFLAFGAVLPVLPRYVHGPIGAGDVAVGAVVGAFAVSALLVRPWAGRLTDARGRRLIVVGGLVIAGAGGALLAVHAGVAGLIVARLVVGIGEGCVFTAASTWVIDLAPVERRGQVIALFGLSVWGGLSAGPLIGEGLRELSGYGAVWAFAALAPVVGALVAATQPDSPPPARGDRRGRGGLISREAIGPGAALALASVGYATFAGFVGLHLAARGEGGGAAVFTGFAAAIVGSRLLLGRVPDRIGARRCAVIAGVAEAAGLAVIALSSSLSVALPAAIAMGVGFALLYPSLAMVVVERAPEERRGAALGTFTAFFDIGFGVGGPLAGALAALGGYAFAFWAAVAAGAGTALIAARVTAPRSAPTPAPSSPR